MKVIVSKEDAWKLDSSMFVVEGSWETGYTFNNELFLMLRIEEFYCLEEQRYPFFLNLQGEKVFVQPNKCTYNPIMNNGVVMYNHEASGFMVADSIPQGTNLKKNWYELQVKRNPDKAFVW